MSKITLKEMVKFHGHLGPWLVLGVLSGESALKKLKAKKYFRLDVQVWGADRKPKSCLIDGLQLSTGATYGKGNIKKFDNNKIKILVLDQANKKTVKLTLKDGLLKKINSLKTHADSEIFAKKLYSTNCSRIFNLTLTP